MTLILLRLKTENNRNIEPILTKVAMKYFCFLLPQNQKICYVAMTTTISKYHQITNFYFILDEICTGMFFLFLIEFQIIFVYSSAKFWFHRLSSILQFEIKKKKIPDFNYCSNLTVFLLWLLEASFQMLILYKCINSMNKKVYFITECLVAFL